jgi:hypothetical protein
MLAHKAEDEGLAVAEIVAGKHGRVNGVIRRPFSAQCAILRTPHAEKVEATGNGPSIEHTISSLIVPRTAFRKSDRLRAHLGQPLRNGDMRPIPKPLARLAVVHCHFTEEQVDYCAGQWRPTLEL